MAAELVELRGHFGISATEALRGIPGWEYDLLVEAVRMEREAEADEAGDVRGREVAIDPDVEPVDPAVPEGLRGL